jgi:hypothetical protein
MQIGRIITLLLGRAEAPTIINQWGDLFNPVRNEIILKDMKEELEKHILLFEDLEVIYDVEFPTLEHLNGGIAHDDQDNHLQLPQGTL